MAHCALVPPMTATSGSACSSRGSGAPWWRTSCSARRTHDWRLASLRAEGGRGDDACRLPVRPASLPARRGVSHLGRSPLLGLHCSSAGRRRFASSAAGATRPLTSRPQKRVVLAKEFFASRTPQALAFEVMLEATDRSPERVAVASWTERHSPTAAATASRPPLGMGKRTANQGFYGGVSHLNQSSSFQSSSSGGPPAGGISGVAPVALARMRSLHRQASSSVSKTTSAGAPARSVT